MCDKAKNPHSVLCMICAMLHVQYIYNVRVYYDIMYSIETYVAQLATQGNLNYILLTSYLGYKGILLPQNDLI